MIITSHACLIRVFRLFSSRISARAHMAAREGGGGRKKNDGNLRMDERMCVSVCVLKFRNKIFIYAFIFHQLMMINGKTLCSSFCVCVKTERACFSFKIYLCSRWWHDLVDASVPAPSPPLPPSLLYLSLHRLISLLTASPIPSQTFYIQKRTQTAGPVQLLSYRSQPFRIYKLHYLNFHTVI